MFSIVSTALQTHIQKNLVGSLKYFFSLRDEFTYSEDNNETGIRIYTEYPEKNVTYPCIVISTISGNPLLRTIGSQTFHAVRGQRIIDGLTISNAICGYVAGGGHSLSIDIDVAANTASERRIIIDYITVALNLSLKDYLGQKGFGLISLQKGRGKDVLLGNKFIRWDTITANYYTEWKEVIYDIPLITKITNVGISTYF